MKMNFDKLLKDDKGSTILGFGFLLPILVGLSFGAIELSTLMFDYHRSNEAIRRAVRIAAIEEPIADLSDFQQGDIVTCQGQAGGAVTCGSGINATATFTDMMAQIQDIQPFIEAENISIIYQDSGLGDPATPGGILPMVSVQINNLQRPLTVVGGFMGFPDHFTFPPFITTQIANGIGTTN